MQGVALPALDTLRNALEEALGLKFEGTKADRNKVKLAALGRVFGFEIMPAPFVVAHLQLGLYLQNLGAPLAEETTTKKGERAGTYLTNALTGWEPPRGPKKQLAFPQMEEERDAAEEVKRDKTILVILGNPPYNAFAGVSAKAEKILVKPYKEGSVGKGKQSQPKAKKEVDDIVSLPYRRAVKL